MKHQQPKTYGIKLVVPKVLATADLHGLLPEILPCDILLVGGDLCPDIPDKEGKYFLMDKGASQQADWLIDKFIPWLESIPASNIVGIAGNHDFVFEHPRLLPELPWIYLKDSSVELDGIKIWGTPWVPGLPRWAFYASEQALRLRAEMIDPDVDILLSHGPPYGYLDRSDRLGESNLNIFMSKHAPSHLVCGHIHEDGGKQIEHPSGTLITNCAYVDEFYDPVHPIMEIKL